MKNTKNYSRKKLIKWLSLTAILLIAITVVNASEEPTKVSDNSQQQEIIIEETDPLSSTLEVNQEKETNKIQNITEPTKEQVKEEIRRQAKLFGLGEQIMLDLAFCESGFRYDAKNSNSTATGVFQYLIGTWGQTMSSRKGISRLDYKANIREAMIDVANGEAWRWQECLDKANLKFY